MNIYENEAGPLVPAPTSGETKRAAFLAREATIGDSSPTKDAVRPPIGATQRAIVDGSARPVALGVNFDALPLELRALKQWVLWRYLWRDGRWTKVPLRPSGLHASVKNALTWNSFDAVRAAYAAGGFNGVGFVLRGDLGLVGVDVDHQLGADGRWSEEALAITSSFASYTEISPSGRGLRFLVRGALSAPGNKRGDFEIYGRRRFVTLTGQHLGGSPLSIESNQNAINDFQARYTTRPQNPHPHPRPTSSARVPLGDEELLHKARRAKSGNKFRALFERGDLSPCRGDASAADMALCGSLAFWTGRSAEQMDRLFRRSSLMRGKWDAVHSGDGRTYGQMTIDAAIAGCARIYGETRNDNAIRETGAKNGDNLAGANEEAVDARNPNAEADTRKINFPDIEIVPGLATNDIGNGQRFAAQHQQWDRYCAPWKTWMIYNASDGRWVRDGRGEVEALAKTTANSIALEAVQEKGEDKRAALLRHAARSTSRGKREVMLKDAQSETGMVLCPGDFDQNPWLLNVQNGTLDLRTGQLRPHSPDDLHSRLAPVAFDPRAKCPLFEHFIGGVFGGDAEMIDCIGRALGSSLTGITRDQVFFPFIGKGSNGKSTLLQTMVKLLGDYAHELDPDTIMVKKHERIAVDIADLHNIRFAVTSESDGEQRLHEGKIKRMTGGEQLTGERKFEHPFTFWPQFKLFLNTNHLPKIHGTDRGIWRRVMPIPFEQTFW